MSAVRRLRAVKASPRATRSLDDFPDLLSPAELQEVLRLGRTATYKLITDGKLHVLRFGRTIRIPREAVRRLIEASA
jgi:excisionase family DNA binding protein